MDYYTVKVNKMFIYLIQFLIYTLKCVKIGHSRTDFSHRSDHFQLLVAKLMDSSELKPQVVENHHSESETSTTTNFNTF